VALFADDGSILFALDSSKLEATVKNVAAPSGWKVSLQLLAWNDHVSPNGGVPISSLTVFVFHGGSYSPLAQIRDWTVGVRVRVRVGREGGRSLVVK
jgi:hypothetical protein